MRLILTMFLIGTTICLCAQQKDTIRENINYKTAQYGSTEKRNSHYIAIQANELLRQLLNLGNNSSTFVNPYTFTYSFNNSKGNGMAFGIGYNTSKVKDNDNGIDRTTNNSSFNFRVGYDKKASIGKRWTAGWGIDLLYSNRKLLTKNDGPFTNTSTDSKTNGWGFGPRGTLLFQVNEKIYLGTEANWYWQHAKTKTTIKPSSGVGDFKETASSFGIQIPVVLFLTLRF